MSETLAATGLTVEQWDDKFFTEYIQDSPFKASMGTSQNSIIQVKQDLTTKDGNKVNYAFVERLVNDAVTGNGVLEGNEEDLTSRSFGVTVTYRRNAVVVTGEEAKKSAIDLRNAAKSGLMDWAMEDQRDLVIQALGEINGVAYGSASEAAKDAWLVDNDDRVLFGAAKANNSSNDHSASLANVDNTNDKLTPEALSLMKRMALEKRSNGRPKVRPIRVAGQNRRYFCVFAQPRAFRDLKDNATITQAQREVGLAKENNRLFEGGDLYWDGMIIKEVDDIDVISGVGASSIDVAPVYLCGAQALGFAWGERWKTKEQATDYDFRKGCGIQGMYGVKKLRFGTGSGDTDDTCDHGIVTGYFAGVADS